MTRALRAALIGIVLAATARSAPARGEEVSATVRSVLADKRYRFCHEDDYPLAPDEHEWCPIVHGTRNAACPSLPKACLLPPVDRLVSYPFGSLGGRVPRHAKSGGAPAPRPETEDNRERPFTCQRSETDLSAMSGFARGVFVLMIVAFVVFVVRIVSKNWIRTKREPEPDAPAPLAPAAGAPVARGPVETDVERLLARAREAAGRGEYSRAVDDAYAALLRRLDGDGRIEIHSSKTNGDYVRALGDDPKLRAHVRSIVRDVEGIQFGSTAASESLFRSVLERVLPIATRAAAFTLLALGLGGVLSCGRTSDDGGIADTSPTGTQALIEVMSKHGLIVRRRSEPLTKLEHPEALVLYPDAVLDEQTWAHVLEWVTKDGGALIVAGLLALPPELEQRISDDTESATTLGVAPGVRWPGHPRVALPAGRRVGPALADADAGPEAAPLGPRAVEGVVLERNGVPVVTERELGDGIVVMVADERLLTNAALPVEEDASFVLSLLFRLAHTAATTEDRGDDAPVVELVDAWTGAGSGSPLQSISRANLTPFLVQLFVLVALFFLWKGLAFSRLRDPPAETRRAFADHARALGMAYRRSRSSRHVAGLYAVWALERLRERVHRAGQKGLIPLTEAIASRTGKPEGEVIGVLVEAVGARDEAAPPSSFRGAPQPPAAARAGDTTEADLALMRELGGYLAATGSRRRGETDVEPSEPASPEHPESRR